MGSTDKIKRLLDDHQAILPVTGVLFVPIVRPDPDPPNLNLKYCELK